MPTPVESLVIHPDQQPKVTKKKPAGSPWVADGQETIYVPVPSHSDYITGDTAPVLVWNPDTGASIEAKEKVPAQGKLRIVGVHRLLQDGTYHPYMDNHNKRFHDVVTANGENAPALVIGYNRADGEHQLVLEPIDGRTPKQVAMHLIDTCGCTDAMITHHADHFLSVNGADEVENPEEPHHSSQENVTEMMVLQADTVAADHQDDDADALARELMIDDEEIDPTPGRDES